MRKLFGNWMMPLAGIMTLLIAFCGTSFASSIVDEITDANMPTFTTINLSGIPLILTGVTNPQVNSERNLYAEIMASGTYSVVQDNGGLVPANIVTNITVINNADATDQAQFTAYSDMMKKFDIVGKNNLANGGLASINIVTSSASTDNADSAIGGLALTDIVTRSLPVNQASYQMTIDPRTRLTT